MTADMCHANAKSNPGTRRSGGRPLAFLKKYVLQAINGVKMTTENRGLVDPLPRLDAKVVGAGAFALILAVALLWSSYVAAGHQFAQWLPFLVLGAAVGWLIGTLISPYSDREQQQFTTYTHLVATGIGGFLAGKLDTILSSVASWDSLQSVRAVSTAAAALLTAIVVSVFRRYIEPGPTRQEFRARSGHDGGAVGPTSDQDAADRSAMASTVVMPKGPITRNDEATTTP